MWGGAPRLGMLPHASPTATVQLHGPRKQLQPAPPRRCLPAHLLYEVSLRRVMEATTSTAVGTPVSTPRSAVAKGLVCVPPSLRAFSSWLLFQENLLKGGSREGGCTRLGTNVASKAKRTLQSQD